MPQPLPRLFISAAGPLRFLRRAGFALFLTLSFGGCLTGCGPSVEERISSHVSVLKNPKASAKERREAAAQLGIIGPRAFPHLVKLMRPEYRYAGGDIAYSIGRMGPDVIPLLVQGLEHGHPFTRGICATTLGAFGPEAAHAAPALEKIAKKDESGVRCAAIFTLGQIGPKARQAAPTLIEAAAGDDPDARKIAREALQKIAPEKLKDIPPGAKGWQGLSRDYRAFSERDMQDLLQQIGRLEYGRFDTNDDWKLSEKELSVQSLLSLAEYDKDGDGFLSFSEAGNADLQSSLKGYKEGYLHRMQGKVDEAKLEKEMQNRMTVKGIAVFLLGVLQKYDVDKDGVLSPPEYDIWEKEAQERVTHARETTSPGK